MSLSKGMHHGRIVAIPDETPCLDTAQLNALEQSFRKWAKSSPRADICRARRRILLIFLLIRYTGAKLSEVLSLDPSQDIDFEGRFVLLGRLGKQPVQSRRKVQLSETLCSELHTIIFDPVFQNEMHTILSVDPGFVRRKFYERAQDCGIAKQLGGPEILRKSRAVEWMQNNVPLPVVQMLLGHSSPNLTSAYVSFSQEDIEHVSRLFMEKESIRKTSARNSFFGKIQTISQAVIQTRIELVTLSGHRITTVITNDSVHRLGLKEGKWITAEVKAPWIILQKGAQVQDCSADNRFKGIVETITRGQINTEYIVRISDGTQVCSIVTSESGRRLALVEGDEVWVLFNSYSVVLRSD